MAVKKTKVVDRWKLKKWYTVVAPQLFDNKELCEIVATDEKSLVNRVIKVSLMELMQTSSQTSMFTFLKFRIGEIAGAKAVTKLIGHDVSPSYIRTFARRGKTLIHQAVDVKTKDDQTVRVKIVAVASGRISNTTKRNLRAKIVEEVSAVGPQFTYDELMQEILYGRMVSKIYNKLKQITSMRRFEVRKTEKHENFA